MVYVFLAEGFEEIEALTPVDLLRRAKIDVKTVGIGGRTVTGAHAIPVTADITEKDIKLDGELHAVILPGGMPGTKNLEKSETVQKTLAYMNAKGGLVCAICAAPSVLGHAGLLKNKHATCFPGFEDQLTGAIIKNTAVVRDGSIITSKGAGTAIEFAAEIISALVNRDTAEKIVASIQKI